MGETASSLQELFDDTIEAREPDREDQDAGRETKARAERHERNAKGLLYIEDVNQQQDHSH